ncbi:MAG TPA: c-type cytochrome [Burkholderiales bacterium]|nr:c-type cytochrome [Burkholderiales bacterium]
MKQSLIFRAALAAVAMGLASPAFADLELAKKYSCVACHQIDKKSIGPAYKDVAAKYKGDAAAPARLADHVKNGSVGVWGQMPMPANSQVPDEDVKKLVAWILAGAK